MLQTADVCSLYCQELPCENWTNCSGTVAPLGEAFEASAALKLLAADRIMDSYYSGSVAFWENPQRLLPKVSPVWNE